MASHKENTPKTCQLLDNEEHPDVSAENISDACMEASRASSKTLVSGASDTDGSSEETEGPDTVSIVSGSSDTGGPDSRPVSR